MFTEGFSFPHPVLGLDDDMQGIFNYSLEIKRNANDRRIKFYNLKYEITNDYIRNLVEEGKAGILIKIYCSSTFKTWTFIDPVNNFEIEENDLFNKIDINILIITKNQISEYSDKSFHPQFSGHTFTINPKEILAITGNMTMKIDKVNEKLGLGNIFKFDKLDIDKPIQFLCNQDKIHIQCPVTFEGEYPPSLYFNNLPWTAYQMFIIPALAEAFRFASEKEDEAKDFEWYTVISNLLPTDKWLHDPFSNAQLVLNKGIPILDAYNQLKERVK